MKPLLYVVIFILLSACSTAVRTSSPTVMGIVQVEKPPFTIIELSLTPWAAGREEGGTGYLFELTLTEPFTTLDSVTYKGNSAVWKQNSKQSDKPIYTANMQEKSTPQKELVLDGDPIKEYGNTPPNRKSDQVAIFYRYRNKPQVYIHTKFQRKEPLLYM
jgi:hypothetical protein